MAQPLNSTSHYPVHSSSIPDPTSSYPSSDSYHSISHTQISRPDVKEETCRVGSESQEVDTVEKRQPKKRRKITEPGNSRKFVSQQKWKFTESQPWLPSKLSTKAQNASQAIGRYKSEAIETKRSASPHVSHYNTDGHQDVAEIESSSNIEPEFHPSKAHAKNPNSSVASGSSLQCSQVNRAILPSPLTSTLKTTEDIPVAQAIQQGTKHSITKFSSDARRSSPSDERHVGSKLRAPRNSSTLSLEKDADRIAALISEKKKENESSEFRQRLLRRQLQHRDQREAASGTEPDPRRRVRLRESRSTTRDSSLGSEESFDTEAEGSITRPDVSMLQRSRDYVEVPMTTISHSALEKRNADRTSEAQQNTLDSRPSGGERLISSSSLSTIPQVRDEHEILFGKQPVTKPARKGDQPLARGTDSFQIVASQPRNGSGPFEVEDADLVTHLAAFNNQLIPGRSISETQIERVSNTRQHSSQYFSKQSSASLAVVRSQNLQRTNSNPPREGHAPSNRSVNTAPLPLDLSSSHSLTILPVEQLAGIGIAASSHHIPIYASGSAQGRPAAIRQPVPHAMPGYYTMSRPSWTTQQASTENTPFTHVTNSMPLHTAAAWGIPSRPAQYQVSPPHLLITNPNKHTGHGKSSSGGTESTPPTKPRVNMFSDTKGTPFPMHEVIRQIEMT